MQFMTKCNFTIYSYLTQDRLNSMILHDMMQFANESYNAETSKDYACIITHYVSNNKHCQEIQ